MIEPYRILSLGGGGTLGVYTLGVLVEIERMLSRPLHAVFDLIYGTSTGSIIASMIALGDSVESTIATRYFTLAPDVMGRWIPSSKTSALERHAAEIYGQRTFGDFVTKVGIVGTHLEFKRPMIFKSAPDQSHGSVASFLPGYGCTIADAVVASCAAYPIFRRKLISTPNHGDCAVVDGGFVANNPTLFALTDALGPLGIDKKRIRLLSIGTGNYPARHRLVSSVLSLSSPVRTIMTLLQTSSNTVETLRKLFFEDIRTVRIDDSFTDRVYQTDFVESRKSLLQRIFQLGRRSFADREHEISSLLEMAV